MNKENFGMNGTKYFLDTNSIIALLKSNKLIEAELAKATWVGTSVICVIEFLSFPNLDAGDKILFNTLLKRVELIDIPKSLSSLEFIADLRKESKLKLPDAIIAAHALENKATLVTADKYFRAVKNLNLLEFS